MRISSDELRRAYGHATRSYPYECFGWLIGTHEDGGTAVRAVPGTNRHAGRADRFEMDASEFLAIESDAEREGLDVIGFYHSHPDWPPVPSAEDIRLAWSRTYYVIIAVHQGHPSGVAVWRLSDDEPRRFTEAALEVTGSAHGPAFSESTRDDSDTGDSA